MMTRAKAVRFLCGFDHETLARWWGDLRSFQWPADMPFFANPLPNDDTHFPLLAVDRMAIYQNPLYSALFNALCDLVPREWKVFELERRIANAVELCAEEYRRQCRRVMRGGISSPDDSGWIIPRRRDRFYAGVRQVIPIPPWVTIIATAAVFGGIGAVIRGSHHHRESIEDMPPELEKRIDKIEREHELMRDRSARNQATSKLWRRKPL